MKSMLLDSDEKIIAVIRKHPFYFLLQTAGLVFLALAPSLLLQLWQFVINSLPINASSDLFTQSAPVSIQAFFYNLWLLFLWLIFITRFTDFFLDKWVLTNKRVIDVEQRGFFAREVSSVRYSKIQDITVLVSGIIPTVLNFGTITIQTAGTEQEFTLTTAPSPVAKKELIYDLRDHPGHTRDRSGV